MEILKDSFEQKLPLLAESINDCDFVAIDAEFTGLHRYPSQHRFQTIQKRYNVLVNAVSNFAIIQFGICTFHWSPTANRYFAKPFNFYVFPRGTKGRKEMNRCFGVQSGAFDFLTTCGFDFNKWVYNGISYLTLAEEKEFEREGLEKLNNAIPDIPVDRKEVEFMSSVKDKIDTWLKTKESNKREGLEIMAGNGYRRRLIYQEVRNNYPKLTAFGKRDCICVCRTNEKKEQQRYLERRMLLEKERKEAIGFRKVIDLMSESKKPIVGHNVFLDLCHMINQFIAPLPQDVKDFKEMVHILFPTVIDTKYLAAKAPDLAHLHSTSLENIYFETRLPPFEGPKVELHWDFPAYQVSKAHEAAYDAYITGYVFLRMSSYIHSKTVPIPTKDEEPMEMEDQGTKEFDPENTYKFNSNSNDDAPEIDISNISWEKKFDNNEAISMHWEDKVKEAAGEFSNEQSLLQESSNSEELSKLVKDEEHTSNLSHTKQEQDKALTEHLTSPKELITSGSPADGTKSESDISEDEQNITCIMKHFENNELLSPYVNKLSIIKAVAEYISLDEPEVLSDHSTVFHVYSKTNKIEEATLLPIVKRLGSHFLEWNGDYSVFVSYDQLQHDQTASKVELEYMLKPIRASVETMNEYIENEAANTTPSDFHDAFNKLNI
ncbi:ribonuclease H-like domain-containing protein [Umbelopsis sp. PMI_123]|nr:ribonuclease H-like domain-containing protein [Umbelopsis sp. PMI_123]